MTWAAADFAVAAQAGMPMPSRAGAGDGQARLPGDRRAGPGDAVQVTDVVLGQAAAPARDAPCDRLRGDADRVAELGGGDGSELMVIVLQYGHVAAAAHGAADDVHRRLAGRVGPLDRGERHGLDGAAVHGGDKVAAALLHGALSLEEGRGAGKASVMMAMDAYGIPAS